MFCRRYQLYAKANKRTAEDQDELNKDNGTVFYYTLWIKDAWKVFCTELGYDYSFRLIWAKEFDGWLEMNYDKISLDFSLQS